MELTITEVVNYPNKNYKAIVFTEGESEFSVMMMYNPSPLTDPHDFYWDSKPLKAKSEIHAQEILNYLIEEEYAEKGIDLYLKH